ncbi:MAG: PKD domain-containing protein, partial [Bacteroidia bacterium]|nr:PKD domain-containing protein [Bacteroidia bacterium]
FSSLYSKANTAPSCSGGFILGNAPVCKDSVWSSSGEQWFSFIADSSSLSISILNSADSTDGHAHIMNLYAGPCGTEVFISADALSNPLDSILQIDTNIFIPGNMYLVQVLSNVPGCGLGCGVGSPDYKICVGIPEPEVTCILQLSCPAVICAGSVVTYDACPSNNCFTLYYWQILDPNNNLITIPLGSCTQTVAYNQCGTYYATVCEVDANTLLPNFLNCQACTVQVYDVPLPTVQVVSTPTCPSSQACFQYSFDACTNTSGASIILDFGDGNQLINSPSPIPNPACHVYNCPGTYTVTLSISATLCGDGTATTTISIPTPQAAFISSSVCVGQVATFIDQSTCPQDIVSWNWDFGDNSTGTGSSPSHTYITSGIYQVTLTITDICGNTSTFSSAITVNSLPQAPTITGPNNTCDVGVPLNYSISNPIPGYQYSWSLLIPAGGTFPIGNTGTSVDIIWLSATVGNTIVVTTTDPSTGCSDTTHYLIFSCCDPNQTVFSICVNNSPALTFAYFITNINNTVSAQNMSPFVAGVNIRINGTLIVNQNTTITNCHFYMGPGAKVIINPGITLVLNDCEFEAGCCYMWDYIFIPDATAKLVVLGSWIEDAGRAVVSDQGGVFDISGTTFNKNNKAIDVFNHPNLPHSGKVVKSVFSCVPGTNPFVLSPGNTMLAPLNGLRSEVGIELNRVFMITLGDGSSISLQNRFNTLDFGIRAYRSGLNTFNNRFTNITQPGPPSQGLCKLGTAICAQGFKNESHLAVIENSTAFNRNLFNNCSFGVVCKDFMDVVIDGNSMSLHLGTVQAGTGIEIFNCPQQSISIINNRFSRFKFGIKSSLTTSGVINISGNFLQNTGNPNKGTAITCMSMDFFALPSGQLNILNNTIDQCQTGINTVSTGYTTIAGNNITFLNALTWPGTYYGIRAQNTAGKIDNNIISKGNPVNAPLQTKLMGISAEISPGIIITNNHLVKMGTGIRCLGAMPLSAIGCNDMLNCYLGIMQEQSDIGQQGVPGQPSDNTWRGIIGINDNTFIPPIVAPNWYYRTNPQSPFTASDFNPLPSLLGSFSTGGPFITSGTYNCSFSGPCPTCKSASLARIVADSIPYNQISIDSKYSSLQMVWRDLMKDSSLMYQNQPSDIILQNFYNSNLNGSLGKQQKVKRHLVNGNFIMAEVENTSVISIYAHENHQKAVNEIYLQTFAIESFEFNPTQDSILNDIASLNPHYAGRAVYDARTMLGINFDDSASFSPNRENWTNQVFESRNVFVYPNPATNSLFLLSGVTDTNTNCLMEIFNSTGMQVMKIPIGDNSITHIDITFLIDGIYFYHLREGPELKFSGKFTVMK